MIKERAMELVKALRSGKYKQAKGALREGNSFCCLGVACDLYAPDLWIGNEYPGSSCEELPDNVIKYFGFFCSSGMPEHGLVEDSMGKKHLSLMEANDVGVTFEDLANFIEKHWEDL